MAYEPVLALNPDLRRNMDCADCWRLFQMKFDYDRNAGLGASEAPAVLGISPWVTPLQLWERKTGRAPADEESLAMRIGSLLEPVVLEQFAARTGLNVTDQQRRIVDPKFSFRWATLDGVASDGALIEAKTTSRAEGWGEEGTDEIPEYYIAQVHHQMAVTGIAVAWVPVLIAAREFRVYKVERDPELIDLLTEQECEFWLHNVRADVPPPPQPAEASRIWKRDSGKQVVADADILSAWSQLASLKSGAKSLEQQIARRENFIKLYMKDASELIDPSGKTLATWKQAKASTKTDWKGLAGEFMLHMPPEIKEHKIANWTETVEGSRRFLLKSGE